MSMSLFLATSVSIPLIIDLVISVGIAVFLIIMSHYLAKRRQITIIAVAFIFAIIAANVFKLTSTAMLLQVAFLCFASSLLIIYSRNLRELFLISKGNRNLANEAVDEKENLICQILEAVYTLSATKTGALITFEKNDSLENYIRAGERVDAPVTSRLIRTIFTPGTPFHDGAIIIKGNIICAAAVFYTPTTRALTGKYGARHRAAMGISEACDALTVVVSEETGRISITQAGEIYGVSRENFEKHLRDRLL